VIISDPDNGLFLDIWHQDKNVVDSAASYAASSEEVYELNYAYPLAFTS
jgi:hypothetical protein